MKSNFFILLSLFLIIGTSCVSRKYAKKGLKFEQAGLYEMAVDAYVKSLSKNHENIEAIAGLKRTGQKVIDDRTQIILNAYEEDDLKKIIYNYLDIIKIKETASSYGVELNITEEITECFNNAKPKYLEQRYNEAQHLLEEEKFQQAEILLKEIKQLQPDFEQVDDLLKVSKCEPLYRDAKNFMEMGFNRKAYTNLDKIIKEYQTYKDAIDLRLEAYEKALITIRVVDFDPFVNPIPKQHLKALQEAVISHINKLNNLFIKIVDEKNSERILAEQYKSISSDAQLELGKIVTAKAILTGQASIDFDDNYMYEKKEKKGYIREERKEKDPKTGEEKVIVNYKKVIYYEITKGNKVVITLFYKLTSTENGTVLINDMVSKDISDEVYYAVFNGDPSYLVPGHWENINSASPEDKVYDDQRSIDELRKLFSNRKDLIPVSTLFSHAVQAVAEVVARKINNYNPEKQ